MPIPNVLINPSTNIGSEKVFCAATVFDWLCPILVIENKAPTWVDLKNGVDDAKVILPVVAEGVKVIGLVFSVWKGPSSL